MPGVNSKCKTRSYVTLCIPVSIYRLTLAWISSKNSTTPLGMPTYPDRSSSLWLDPISCRLVSLLFRVDSSVRRPSPTLPRAPLSNSLTGVPFLTSSHPRSLVQNPLSGFAPKQTKESSASRTNYIVLQDIIFTVQII